MPEDKMPLPGGRELFYVQYKITGLGLLRLSRELDFKIDEIESNDDEPKERRLRWEQNQSS